MSEQTNITFYTMRLMHSFIYFRPLLTIKLKIWGKSVKKAVFGRLDKHPNSASSPLVSGAELHCFSTWAPKSPKSVG